MHIMSKKPDIILAQIYATAYDKIKELPVDILEGTVPGQRLIVAATLLNHGVTPEDAARATGLLDNNQKCPPQFRSAEVDPEEYLGRK